MKKSKWGETPENNSFERKRTNTKKFNVTAKASAENICVKEISTVKERPLVSKTFNL